MFTRNDRSQWTTADLEAWREGTLPPVSSHTEIARFFELSRSSVGFWRGSHARPRRPIEGDYELAFVLRHNLATKAAAVIGDRVDNKAFVSGYLPVSLKEAPEPDP